MQKAILTLSKNTNLIEQIRSNLEEGGRYYVQGVTSAHGSLAMVRHRMFDVAILDLDESDLTATQLVYNLKKIQGEIRILFYTPENPAQLSEINELPIDGILKRPFFAPELSELLKLIFKPLAPEEPDRSVEQREESNHGTHDQQSGGSLEEMSLLLAKTNAVSCMIFYKGEIVNQSAGFSRDESQRVVDYVAGNWKTFKNCEICRFMRMEEGLDAQLVYALSLGGDSLLVFTYPASVDLRTVRNETSKVRDAYMIGRYSKPKNSDRNSASTELTIDEGAPVGRGEAPDLSDLDSMPVQVDHEQAHWIPEFDDVKVNSQPDRHETSQDTLADTQPVPVRRETPAAASETTSNSLLETASALPQPASEKVEPKEDSKQEPIGDEGLIYHCLIVPRDSNILLTQKLSEVSSTLIREIHLANGWSLTQLTIRPLYILWSVRLPTGAKPAKVVDAVKESTMRQLAASFPDQVSAELPFWAPGYWILSGGQPPSGKMIEQFIKFRNQKNSDSPND